MSARKPSTFADVLRTVLVFGVVLLGIALIGKVYTVDPGEPKATVDPAGVVPGAARQAGTALWAPLTLPVGWHANAAEWRGDVWHIGVITAAGDYIGLEQAKSSTRAAVREFAGGSRAAGQVNIGGHAWSRRTEADGDTVYVRRTGETTILVIGSAPPRQIERYISSLVSTGA